MSAELTKARTLLNGVRTNLKKDKLLPAVTAVHESLLLVLRTSLMKAERDEFARMLEDAVFALNGDDRLRKIYPLVINYQAGEEKALYETISELLKELQANVTEDVQKQLADKLLQKQRMIDQGQALIDSRQFEKARAVFDTLVREHQNDTDLKADIADRFLKAERYQDAFAYLDEALRHDPNAIHLYNRIGMVLRKMADYETAERYYKKALEISREDEYLYFNIGRLYMDWGKWVKVEEAAEKALRINPGFEQAEKMRKFAQKKLGR